MLKSAYGAYRAHRSLSKTEKDGGDPAKQFAGQAAGMASIIETMWHMSVLDIESTLRSSCNKIFKDSGVPMEQRLARAEALCILAAIFDEFSQTHETGLAAFRNHLHDEMKARFFREWAEVD